MWWWLGARRLGDEERKQSAKRAGRGGAGDESFSRFRNVMRDRVLAISSAMSSSSVRNVSMARGIIKLYRVIASSGQGEGARDMGEVWRDFIQTERGFGGEAAQGVELSGADF